MLDSNKTHWRVTMDQNAKKLAVAKAAIEYVENDSIVGVHRTGIGPSDLNICFARIALKSHSSFCAALIISHTLGT